MEGILEIRNMLSDMGQKERRAARKYFSRYYSNTKELQLFKLIEKLVDRKRINVGNRIQNMGYSSFEDKSFQKLRTRLKHKLFEYLISNVSLNEIKNIDDNSYLKQKLKKMNLQAAVLIEKGFFDPAMEILQLLCRLAHENEQLEDEIQALEKIKHIHDLSGNLIPHARLILKIKGLQSKYEKISAIDFSFHRLITVIDIESMDHLQERIENLIHDIDKTSLYVSSKKLKAFTALLKSYQFLAKQNFNDSLFLIVKWLKTFRDNAQIFDIHLKMLFHNIFVETLLLSGKVRQAIHFMNVSKLHLVPEHFKLRLYHLDMHHRLIQSSPIVLGVQRPIESKSRNQKIGEMYYIIHQHFNMDNPKMAMYFINKYIRDY